MPPPAVDEAAASSGLRSSVRRRLGLHQRPFWGVFYGALMLPQNPNEIGRLLFVPRLKLLLVDGDFERSFKRKEASREGPVFAN